MLMMLFDFLVDETGETLIEYGLVAAIVSLTIITAVTSMGSSLTTFFTYTTTKLTSAITPGG